MELSDYLTTEQAAAQLRCTREHIQRLCRDFLRDPTTGLRCRREGGVHRATFIIDPEAVAVYGAVVHKPGAIKGRPRGARKAPPTPEGNGAGE